MVAPLPRGEALASLDQLRIAYDPEPHEQLGVLILRLTRGHHQLALLEEKQRRLRLVAQVQAPGLIATINKIEKIGEAKIANIAYERHCTSLRGASRG